MKIASNLLDLNEFVRIDYNTLFRHDEICVSIVYTKYLEKNKIINGIIKNNRIIYETFFKITEE